MRIEKSVGRYANDQVKSTYHPAGSVRMMCLAFFSFIAFIAFIDILVEKGGLKMSGIAHRQMPPSAQEAAIARVTSQTLARHIKAKRPLRLRVTDAEQEEPIELPAGAVTMLMDILEAMAAGRGVTLIPVNAELTTVQAAEILNVSRPFLIKLLEAKKIRYRKVGKHRRLLMEDVMAYKRQIDVDREATLDQLVADAQQKGMGYGD